MSDYKYRGFGIQCICHPIPSRLNDYAFYPENFDDDPTDGYAYPELHGFGETLESCKKQIDDILADLPECKECCGRGWIAWSCCGDDISLNDYDNCPTCYEHCSTGEEGSDYCEICRGLGKIVDEVNQTA